MANTQRIGVYLRISDDPLGTQTATDRQREDCTRFAQSQGWQITDVFEDVDLSAFKRNVKRPEFERMLESVRTKAIDGVLAWKIDRITRRQRDLVRLDEACEDADGFIATVVDAIDTRSPTGRFVAELLVAQARMESENTSIRVKRQQKQRAERGAPGSGGFRAFGYDRSKQHVTPEEAALIREAMERVFAGESLYGIATDWHERGVVTPVGKPWRPTSSLVKMLTSAAISGQREHEGRLYPGTWPAILTPEETSRLRAVLKNPARQTGKRAPRAYLLTGLIYCGLCGGRLNGGPIEGGRSSYKCRPEVGYPKCGGVGRNVERVEATVFEMIATRLENSELPEHRPAVQDGSIAQRIREDEEQLDQLAQDHGSRLITRREWLSARDVVLARLEVNRRDLARTSAPASLATLLAGERLRDRWPDAPLAWRRAVIAALVDKVYVDPLTPGARGRAPFDPTKIRVEWRV